ncbi:PIN domain-containing protein [Archaeoglobus sp.]
MIVLDTDILSCFSKIRKFDLLEKLFKAQFYIPPRVYEEILRAKEKGYDFVDYAIKLIDDRKIRIATLNETEVSMVKELAKKRKLGFGEIEAMALAKNKGWILLSNDKVVEKIAREIGVDVFNIEDILSAMIEFGIIGGEIELKDIIEEIETKDRMVIRNKEYLFRKIFEK